MAGDLVLSTKVEFGFLGIYNKDYGPSPFEGYNMGGDGLVSYNLYGKETISLRGYGNGSISPLNGGNIYDKFSFEVRYPLSLNPNATLYLLTFAEGGNSWNKFEEFKVFKGDFLIIGYLKSEIFTKEWFAFMGAYKFVVNVKSKLASNLFYLKMIV